MYNLEKHTNSVRTLTFSRAGNYLVSSSSDKSIIIWDTRLVNENYKYLQGIYNYRNYLLFKSSSRIRNTNIK